MLDSTRELFSTLFQLVSYVYLVVQIGIAVAAFLRFKATLSGILIGGGAAALVVTSVLFKIIHAVLKAAAPGPDALIAATASRSFFQFLLLLVIAVGVAMIPASLEKLQKRA